MTPSSANVYQALRTFVAHCRAHFLPTYPRGGFRNRGKDYLLWEKFFGVNTPGTFSTAETWTEIDLIEWLDELEDLKPETLSPAELLETTGQFVKLRQILLHYPNEVDARRKKSGGGAQLESNNTLESLCKLVRTTWQLFPTPA